jgi:hypothetical protein
MKKPEDVRLEGVLEYGERLRFKRGYYFMDRYFVSFPGHKAFLRCHFSLSTARAMTWRVLQDKWPSVAK